MGEALFIAACPLIVVLVLLAFWIFAPDLDD